MPPRDGTKGIRAILIDSVVVGEWECMECGCIVKGAESRRPPECPECGASSRALEFFADDAGEDDFDDTESDETH